MEFFAPLIGLLSGVMGQGSQSASLAMQQQNLNLQRQNADRQYRLSTAGRQDPYGNKSRYDEGLNEFVTDLTPTQSQIVKGGEREQLRSLLEDAPRNRAIRERAAERGKDAAEDYAGAVTGFKFGTPDRPLPKSELALRDELTGLMTTQQNLAGKENQDRAIRDALRYGKKNQIPQIIKAADDDMGQRLQKIQLAAREGGLKESGGRWAAHQSQYMPLIKSLEDTMDKGGDMQPRFADMGSYMGQQGDMSKGIMAALQNEAANVGGAMNAMSSVAGKSPMDLTGMARLITAMQGGGKGKTSSQAQKDIDQDRAQDGSDYWGDNPPWSDSRIWNYNSHDTNF